MRVLAAAYSQPNETVVLPREQLRNWVRGRPTSAQIVDPTEGNRTEALWQASGLLVLRHPAHLRGGEQSADSVGEHERIGIRERTRRGDGFGGAAEERCPIFARASRSSERWAVQHAAAPTDRGPHATSYLARPLRRQPEAFVRRHDHGLPPRLARRLKVSISPQRLVPPFWTDASVS